GRDGDPELPDRQLLGRRGRLLLALLLDDLLALRGLLFGGPLFDVLLLAGALLLVRVFLVPGAFLLDILLCFFGLVVRGPGVGEDLGGGRDRFFGDVARDRVTARELPAGAHPMEPDPGGE